MRYSACLWLTIGFCFLPILGSTAQDRGVGGIRGRVTAQESGRPLAEVNLVLMMERDGVYDTLRTVSDSTGVYSIDKVSAGLYRFEASHVGFQKVVLEDLVVKVGIVLRQDFVLLSGLIPLKEVVVNPGQFSVLEDDPAAPRALTREEIQAIPYVMDDIYRAVERLPGVSGGDFSARFTVRGGEYDQILVTLDGLELFEPFHLKDLGGGVLSIVDVEMIGGVDMMTGGFPVEYGDRQSAVLEMRSRRPVKGKRVSAGLGVLNTRVLVEAGTEKFGWLLSARRGFMELMLRQINPDRDLSPTYHDIFSKVTYSLGSKNTLGFRGLWASDQGKIREIDGDLADSSYDNGYLWLTWEVAPGGGLFVRNLPYVGRITQQREATLVNSTGNVGEIVDDVRKTSIYGFKSDWKFQAGKSHFLKFGIDFKWQKADYDYFSWKRVIGERRGGQFFNVNYNLTQVLLRPSGWELGLYAGDKWRLFGPVTTEAGVRYDRYSHTAEGQTSPRVGLAIWLNDRTVLRTGWGKYYQAQDLGSLDVRNGMDQFQTSALATHYVAGIERQVGPGFQARVEVYHKAYQNIWNRFENLNQSHTIDPLPELAEGWVQVFPRVGTARGLEIFFKRDMGTGLNWWASYALTTTHETYHGEQGHPGFRSQKFSRKFDQLHSISFDLIYRPASNWFLGVAWQGRSGWPYTPMELLEESRPNNSFQSGPLYSLTYGAFHSQRYPVYHRLDVKLSHWRAFNNWRLMFAIGMSNLYGQKNIRRYSYYVVEDKLNRLAESWLPPLPVFSVSAEF